MKIAVAVFVKTPGLSPLKTRLAKDIGQERALDIYRRSCVAVASVVSAFSAETGADPYWAVAEDSAFTRWQGFQVIAQGAGGLGNRLHEVYGTLSKKYDAVVLLGADCPQICVSDLRKAVALSKQSTCAIGCARDGGFYLFAGRGKVPKRVWLDVPYSASNTRAILVAKLAQLGWTVYELSEKTDIDTGADIATVLAELTAITSEILPEQQELYALLSHAGKDPHNS